VANRGVETPPVCVPAGPLGRAFCLDGGCVETFEIGDGKPLHMDLSIFTRRPLRFQIGSDG
jgi:hypothetical protein